MAIGSVETKTVSGEGAAVVHLFAALADIAGRRELVMEIDAPVTVMDVYLRLCHRFPGLGAYRDRLLFAVNGEYITREEPLAPGDELCLIPPVSGG